MNDFRRLENVPGRTAAETRPVASDPDFARRHWQRVYRSKKADAVSWYRPHLDRSLEWIRATGADLRAPILDVGGGASTLVDDLLAAGYESISVVDVSAEALAIARRRLGDPASRVHWIEGDITRLELPPAAFEIWHDRAALHFLVDAGSLRRYVEQLRRTLAPGGHVILATFAPEGPRRCSDLPVQRYAATGLDKLLGAGFVLRRSAVDRHTTPSGAVQPFTYCWLSRTPGDDARVGSS